AALQQVLSYGIRVARVRGTDELPPPLAHQPVLAHQPGNPLARGGQPLSPECRVYPERSVATAAPAVSCAHVDAQTLVRSHSRRTSTRCLACHGVVEAAPAHLEQPAHEPHREQAPVSIDGGVPYLSLIPTPSRSTPPHFLERRLPGGAWRSHARASSQPPGRSAAVPGRGTRRIPRLPGALPRSCATRAADGP